MGLGWLSTHGSGKGVDAITSGIEGPWTANPTHWDMGYFDLLLGYEWELTKSPAGAHIWHPKDLKDEDHAPQVDGSGTKVIPMMTTADMAMRMDPAYEKISRRFHANPEEFADAFARAWFKLTHRDMGPKAGIWAACRRPDLAGSAAGGGSRLIDGTWPTQELLDCGLSVSQLVTTAWASASSYRVRPRGANGARIRLASQKDWEVNQPEELASYATGRCAVGLQCGPKGKIFRWPT